MKDPTMHGTMMVEAEEAEEAVEPAAEPDDEAGDVRGQLAEIDAKARQGVVEHVGGQAPEAETPLPGGAVGALYVSLSEAMSNLSGGEMSLPEMPLPKGDLDRMPAEPYAALVAFQGAMQAAVQDGVAAARPYVFDPKAAASSEEGIMSAIDKVRQAGEDAGLKAALQRQVGGGAAPPEPAKPPAPVDPAARIARVMLDRGTRADRGTPADAGARNPRR